MKTKVCFALLIAYSVSLFAQESVSFSDFKKLPFKTTGFYGAEFRIGAEDKIHAVPPAVMAYLRAMDGNKSYADYPLSADEKALFTEYCGFLPESLKNVFREKVLAVYFVKNFMGAGMTEEIFDENDDPYIVMYLNPELFKKSLTEWIQFRDASCFGKGSKHSKYAVSCSTDYKGLLYGATNWADDFAETFTWYYLKQKFNIEYRVSVFDGSAKVAEYIPTDNESVKARYARFGAIMEEPGRKN